MVAITAACLFEQEEIGEEQELIASLRGTLAVYEELLVQLIEKEAAFNPTLMPKVAAKLDALSNSAVNGDPEDKWDECYRMGISSTAERMRNALKLLQGADLGTPRAN